MKWTTKWLSFICSQSCVYVINATVTVAGSHGVAPSRPKRRKPTNDKLMTQQTTLQKIRFENGLAVAKSKIEYVMCRIEEIRLQLQGLNRRKSDRFWTTNTWNKPQLHDHSKSNRTPSRQTISDNLDNLTLLETVVMTNGVLDTDLGKFIRRNA